MNQQLLKDAYFAGLIDGEGCIYLHKKGTGLRPIVQVNMTCINTLNAIQNHFGVGTIRPMNIRTGHWLHQWRWRVYYNDARFVLTRTLPFLITKKEAAENVLSHRSRKKEAADARSAAPVD